MVHKITLSEATRTPVDFICQQCGHVVKGGHYKINLEFELRESSEDIMEVAKNINLGALISNSEVLKPSYFGVTCDKCGQTMATIDANITEAASMLISNGIYIHSVCGHEIPSYMKQNDIKKAAAFIRFCSEDQNRFLSSPKLDDFVTRLSMNFNNHYFWRDATIYISGPQWCTEGSHAGPIFIPFAKQLIKFVKEDRDERHY